jgi:hypothetical protein
VEGQPVNLLAGCCKQPWARALQLLLIAGSGKQEPEWRGVG